MNRYIECYGMKISYRWKCHQHRALMEEFVVWKRYHRMRRHNLHQSRLERRHYGAGQKCFRRTAYKTNKNNSRLNNTPNIII